MKRFYFLLLLLAVTGVFAQKKKKSTVPTATPATERWEGYQIRQNLTDNSLVKNVEFRNVGPTVMSGRVVDIAVNPSDPTHFIVAYASGGLWETTNEGASFTSLFDNQIVMTIGDIAVDWKNDIIYLGSGENNSSRSSYSGYGMFRSTDHGQSWEHIGLPESHHIGRIIIHPEDPNTLFVGVLGHLYSENEERGLYKSTDGGSTWNKILYVDERTGIIDLIMNPIDPDELIAAAWEKDRKAWNFVEAGPGSGLYKSTDGGATWINISEGDNGFPDTNGMGRVGLDYGPDGSIYVVLDNQDRRSSEEEEEFPVTKDVLREISNEDFLNLSNKDLNDFLDRNNFPRKYNAVDIKEDVTSGKVKPLDLVIYLEDANSLLFDTPVKGGEVYVSKDGGNNWQKTHEGFIDSFVNSYGYYFGQIRVDPQNQDQLYILGVPLLSSDDGGVTWQSMDQGNVHADHHALWVNPERSGHLINGNDGGINITYDNGENWIHCNSLPVGQFYSVNVDMAEPYNVYGGLQDNGVWKGPSNYRFSTSWHSNGNYPYERLMGGDGMQVAIDTRNNEIVYTGYQFGNYFRINTATGDRKYITPVHELGDPPYRWNWEAPIMLSHHNQDIVYFGSNRFHRSLDQGENFETTSGDLTQGGKKGDVSYGTLTTISESPLRFGLIYVGSDDGLIHVSRDVGESWSNISEGLPKNYWVSQVFASNHSEGRVYVTLNGYRWDNFEALIYKSDDYGQNWEKIGNDLPKEPINVVKEDPKNENLIYVGTDHGAYVSLDQGKVFMKFQEGLNGAPVHDLVVHPRENDLVLGTHGRSIYIGDISLVQQLTPNITSKALHLFSLDATSYSERWGSSWSPWRDPYQAILEISFFSGNPGVATIEIMQEDQVLKSWEIDSDQGLNFTEYDMTLSASASEEYQSTLSEEMQESFGPGEDDQYYLRPGTYLVKVSDASGNSADAQFEVKAPRERRPRKGSE
jgi:photosystem II stability/assembly factor-like uncharacterized protein